MRITDFDLYQDLLREKCGLSLNPDQSYRLDSRLRPIAAKWGFDSMDGLTLALRGIADPGLIKDVVEAMMAHESSFFRDYTPFQEFSRSALPYFCESRKKTKKLRLWSAGCASGQEPYSLALLLKERKNDLKNWDVGLLATDISATILDRAREGLYSQYEAQCGLSAQKLLEHFDQEGGNWRLKESLRKVVTFRMFNLLDSLAPLGTFDVIFCRNVLSGFDRDIAARVLRQMVGQLTEDGVLCLGLKENLPLPDGLEPAGNGLYVFSSGPHSTKEQGGKALAT